jgi:hypothetical protein
MMNKTTLNDLLQFIQVAIKGEADTHNVMASPDMADLFRLASSQGAKGLVWQGIELLIKANQLLNSLMILSIRNLRCMTCVCIARHCA